MPRLYTPQEAVEAFWAKVDRETGPTQPHMSTPCWVWTGANNHKGYGCLRVRGERRNEHAHRHSWALANGPIPDGLWVLHHCDHPPCVNPDHLFLGTVKTNSEDMARKGRGKNQISFADGPLGDAHPAAKLTEAIVRECRIRAAAGELQPELAREFGVGLGAMHNAIRRRTWKHVV